MIVFADFEPVGDKVYQVNPENNNVLRDQDHFSGFLFVEDDKLNFLITEYLGNINPKTNILDSLKVINLEFDFKNLEYQEFNFRTFIEEELKKLYFKLDYPNLKDFFTVKKVEVRKIKTSWFMIIENNFWYQVARFKFQLDSNFERTLENLKLQFEKVLDILKKKFEFYDFYFPGRSLNYKGLTAFNALAVSSIEKEELLLKKLLNPEFCDFYNQNYKEVFHKHLGQVKELLSVKGGDIDNQKLIFKNEVIELRYGFFFKLKFPKLFLVFDLEERMLIALTYLKYKNKLEDFYASIKQFHLEIL